MIDIASQSDDAGIQVLVPVRIQDQVVLVAAEQRAGRQGIRDEAEIGARRPNVDQMLAGVAAFAQEVAASIRGAEVSRVTVEFGCEFAVESGVLVAVIGKATGRSSIKVGLEWSQSPQQ